MHRKRLPILLGLALLPALALAPAQTAQASSTHHPAKTSITNSLPASQIGQAGEDKVAQPMATHTKPPKHRKAPKHRRAPMHR
jgi:hypothetical protein